MNRAELLESALDAVNRRPKSYGPPEQNFERIARFWNAHLFNRYGTSDGDIEPTLDAVDVAAMMVLMKVARLEETPDHIDSWVDIAGYAACGAEVSTGVTIEGEVAPTPPVNGGDGWVEVTAEHPLPLDLKVGDLVRFIDTSDRSSEGVIAQINLIEVYSAEDCPYQISVDGDRPQWWRSANATAYRRQ